MLSRPQKKPKGYYVDIPTKGDYAFGYNQSHDDHTPYIEWIKEEHRKEIIKRNDEYLQDLQDQMDSLLVIHRNELVKAKKPSLDVEKLKNCLFEAIKTIRRIEDNSRTA